MADLNKAKDRIEKILCQWFMDDPIMLEAIGLFKKIPSKEQKTMGIDTRSRPPVIKYNPNFVNGISKERLECVMAQEGFKILLKHPTTRLCNPKNMSALASSITVVPFSLGNLLNENNMEDFYPTPEEYGFPKDECFEEYFRRLMDKREDVLDKIKKTWNSMSKEEKEKTIQDAINKQKQQQGEGQEQQGEGQGQGDENTDEDGYTKFDSQNQAMKEYFDPNSTNNMDWGDNPILDADIKNIVNNSKGNPKQWGKMSGDMFQQIITAHSPKISWKEVIRRFNKTVISRYTMSSRMKLNRRHDLRLPGKKRLYNTHIIFAIDCSGSMSDEDLAEGFAVINSVCGHAKITYVLFDTEIKQVEKNFKKAKKEFKVTGRGGTDFQEVVNFADNETADGLVIYTDGWASAPSKPKNTKVLWLLNGKDQGQEPPVDWGFIAHLDRYE